MNDPKKKRRSRLRSGLLIFSLILAMFVSPECGRVMPDEASLPPSASASQTAVSETSRGINASSAENSAEVAGAGDSFILKAHAAQVKTAKAGSSGVVSKELNTENAALAVTMLDVGQGLSVLVESDGHYLMYDGGGRSSSSFVVSYLKEHGITHLDYIISSHYDEDHLSGLIGVLRTVKVKKALTAGYTHDSKTFQSFKKALSEKKVSEKHPTAGASYSFGKAKIQVVGPSSYEEVESNENS
ncbi:MAG: MBL fold metallo-hydrolase, partial [Eubacteriales bacterium]|nr:MBL fold metallo-hydrolase [Eubacteriales bacterium]